MQDHDAVLTHWWMPLKDDKLQDWLERFYFGKFEDGRETNQSEDQLRALRSELPAAHPPGGSRQRPAVADVIVYERMTIQ